MRVSEGVLSVVAAVAIEESGGERKLQKERERVEMEGDIDIEERR